MDVVILKPRTQLRVTSHCFPTESPESAELGGIPTSSRQRLRFAAVSDNVYQINQLISVGVIDARMQLRLGKNFEDELQVNRTEGPMNDAPINLMIAQFRVYVLLYTVHYFQSSNHKAES